MSKVAPILLGGAMAGLLDLVAAFAISWPRVSPLRVLQYIASGALGPAAFRGGVPAALAGLAFHFGIATAAAAVYVGLASVWPVLRRRPWVCGTVYGLAVYACMNLVVLPLSRAALQRPTASSVTVMAVIHVVCVGLPIALAARRSA